MDMLMAVQMTRADAMLKHSLHLRFKFVFHLLLLDQPHAPVSCEMFVGWSHLPGPIYE
jgi:hypothetical protein